MTIDKQRITIYEEDREECSMKIGEFLIENNYVTQEEVNEALELQKRNKDQYIGEILVKMNVITREQLIKYVCEYDMEV